MQILSVMLVATKNLIHKISSGVAPRCSWRGVWGYFTNRENVTNQSRPFTQIFNLASNPLITNHNQSHNQLINQLNNRELKQ